MSYNVLNVTRGILLGREMYKALGALEIAAKAHEGQTRKGSGEDYINHPLAVATELLSSGCTTKTSSRRRSSTTCWKTP